MSIVNSAYCRGEIKATNLVRDLLSCFGKGVVPASWRSQSASSQLTVGSWIADLAARIKALDRYGGLLQKTSAGSGEECVFWLGGMFAPEAFVTATRQLTAQVNRVK